MSDESDESDGVFPDKWDGVEERRSQIRACTGNCLDHTGSMEKIDSLRKDVAIVLEDHETVIKFSDRVNLLLLVFSFIGLSILGGAIYIFVTNSNFSVKYANDMTKVSETIHSNQERLVGILNKNQEKTSDQVEKIKEAFNKQSILFENRLILLESKRDNAEIRALKFDDRVYKLEIEKPNKGK